MQAEGSSQVGTCGGSRRQVCREILQQGGILVDRTASSLSCMLLRFSSFQCGACLTGDTARFSRRPWRQGPADLTLITDH